MGFLIRIAVNAVALAAAAWLFDGFDHVLALGKRTSDALVEKLARAVA